ncbi:MAG: UDP-glucose 4-epimerase GalE [Alphaproteobacteria bacterium]
MTQTILVSGGAGYIGSHAAYALREAGWTPVVIDNLCHGHTWAAAFGPFRQGDVGDADFVRAVCAEFNPVALMHFAAFIEVGESVKFPEKYWDNNTERAKRLFATVRECGVRHTVFSSTAAVYGVPEISPLPEDLPLRPINPYGASKLAAEQALRELDGMGSVALRYFNAAGAAPAAVNIGEAHWPESHLLPNAILAALGYKPALTIFGTDYPTPDGTAVRDYVHVRDLAAAHIAALRYLLAGGATTVCNLGCGAGYSVRQVVDMVGDCVGMPVPAHIGARRAGDPPTLVADSARARQILGWSPHYGLRDIVASAVAWHQGARYRDFIAGVGSAG